MRLVLTLQKHPIQYAVLFVAVACTIFVFHFYELRASYNYWEFALEFLTVCFWWFLMFACSLARQLGKIYTLLLTGTAISFLSCLLDMWDEFAIFTSINTVEDISQSIGLVLAGLGLWLLLKYQNHQQQTLRVLASTDPLTGALNRRSFNSSSNLKTGVFALVDVDHFKQINDRFGHDAGDFVLVELSRLIKSEIRSDDQFFRWGGEEFLLEFNNANLDEASMRMDSLRMLVAQHGFHFGGRTIQLTISAGLAAINHHQGGIESAIKAADDALYRAKQNGRNRVECAEDTLPT